MRKMADEEPENDEEQDQNEAIDRQIRTHKALQHMEHELQLPTATVLPVLLKLMKVRTQAVMDIPSLVWRSIPFFLTNLCDVFAGL